METGTADGQQQIREFTPLLHLLSRIPLKAQKGLTTLPLNFTCVAAAGEFLALGTNVGLIYWFNRTSLRLDRLKTENTSSPISSISLLSRPDILVGAGNADGELSVFQIPPEGRVRSFQLSHKSHSCKISAIEWSSNGLKLFSGDVRGGVVLTELLFDTGTTRSQALLQEKGEEIVQLSYSRKHLLVCSTFQSVVYSLTTKETVRVGSQARKIQGRFGGIFRRRLTFTEPLSLYSVRPGGRLWVADSSGLVQHTIKFKDLLLLAEHANIPILNPARPTPSSSPSFDFQIGRLLPFSSTSLLTFHSGRLYLLDPIETTILGVCSELQGILDVAINQENTKEIFVLESNRNLIRLAPTPDTFPMTIAQEVGPPNFLRGRIPLPIELRGLEVPLSQLLSSTLKETSRFVGPVHASLVQGLRQVFEGDISDGMTSIPLPPPDSQAQMAQESHQNDQYGHLFGDGLLEEEGVDKFGHISHLPFDDVLLLPPTSSPSTSLGNKGRRNKKKKRRERVVEEPVVEAVFQSSGDTHSLSSSTYSTTASDEEAGQLNGGGKRKLSALSSSQHNLMTTRDITLDEEGCKGTTAPLLVPMVAMSQSWSVGQGAEDEVLTKDLESKEELLAKRLNWPELLPNYKRTSTTGEKHITNTPQLETSTLTLSLPQMQTDLNSRMEDEGSDTLIKTWKEEEKEEEALEESLDIYTKYRKKGAMEEDDETPPLSFGPPSSISTTNSVLPCSLTTLHPHIVEIDEGTLSSSNPDSPSTSEELVPVRDMVVEPLALGGMMDQHDHWISFEAPAPLHSITTCDTYLVGIDKRKRVYVAHLSQTTSSLHWMETRWKADAIALSPSGTLVWRLLRGVLYSAPNINVANLLLGVNSPRTTWARLLSDISSISLSGRDNHPDDPSGWVVKLDGSIYSYSAQSQVFTKLPTPPTPMFHVAMGGSRRLWGLGADGRLFCRGPEDEDWVKVTMPITITSLAPGPSNSVWVGDQGGLYFVEEGTHQVWKVSLGEYLNTASGGPLDGGGGDCRSISSVSSSNSSGFSLSSIRHKLSDSLRPDRLTSLVSRAGGTQNSQSPILAATTSALWFGLRGSNTLHLNQSLVTGHRWDSIQVHRPCRAGNSWKKVLGGSIYLEVGVLWVVDDKGKLFYVSSPSKGRRGEAIAIDLPTSSPLLAVVPAPDALWILNEEGIIFARNNISSVNPQGHGWSSIDLSSQENFRMVHISCGSDIAWGCDHGGRVFFRVGSLRPPSPMELMSPPWVQVQDETPLQNSTFTKVYVGTNGNMVWALDSKNNIFVREAVFPDFPIGTRWLLVSGVEAVSLALSETSVWALTPKGTIFRRVGISSSNFVGDYWKRVPGPSMDNVPVQDLTVSLCDQVWALDPAGMHKHCATKLKLEGHLRQPRQRTLLDPEDRDWVLIESLDLV